jgi:hypothetical protein
MRPRMDQIFSILLILFGVSTAAAGQVIGTVTEKKSEPTRTRRDAPAKVETRYIVKTVTPTTGQLFVATDPPGAVILLEPMDPRNKDSRQAQVPEDRRDWVFNDLRPGQYRVAATKSEYHQTEQTITIERNKPSRMTLDLEPIYYTVVVQANVDGDLKYGKTDEVPKSVTIQNGRVTLHVTAGEYVATIEPSESVYKSEQQRFKVTGETSVNFKLKRMEFSKDTLSANWTEPELKNWEVPSTWHTSAKTLIVKGAGIGLPRDESKRYYKDFHLVSDIKLTNGLGAAFALRAQDARNYYLLEFTGPQADEPLYVRLFYVKDGFENRIQAIQIPNAAAATLKNPQSFTSVIVKVNDNKFTAEIYDNNTATSYPLGVLMDQDRRFTAGGVGVAARQNSESVVSRFIVCTECPKE